MQPFAGVHGHNEDVAFLASPDAAFARELFALLEPNWRAAGATFVTDALDGNNHHAYVDAAHYNAKASRLIAEAIATRVIGGMNK